MFDSQVKANDFILALKSETDIAPDIPDSYFIDWLNHVEQTLYDNVIKEEEVASYSVPAGSGDSKGFRFYSAEYDDIDQNAPVRFEDIVSVTFVGRGLTKVSMDIGEKRLFPYCYYREGEVSFKCYIPEAAGTLILIYTVRPTPKTITNITTQNIMVPPEFLDLVRAKLRGEAYKFANEDALAAKWLNDYNQQLEYFRAWIASNKSTFGA